MPPATDRHQGQHEVVYVTDSEPATLTDPGEYTVLGMRTTSGLTTNAPEVTIEDVHGATTTYGTASGTYTVGWNRSKAGDDGQALIRDAAAAATQGVHTPLWFLISSNVPGEEATHFHGTLGSYTKSHDNNAASTESVTVGLDGGFHVTTIPSP